MPENYMHSITYSYLCGLNKNKIAFLPDDFCISFTSSDWTLSLLEKGSITSAGCLGGELTL